MKRTGAALSWAPAMLLAAAAIFVVTGCGKNMPLEPVRSSPTPAPTHAVGGLNGAWTGTMSGYGDVAATVLETATYVRISLDGYNPSFTGTLNDGRLSGDFGLAGNIFCPSVSRPAIGTATPSHIHLGTQALPSHQTVLGTCPGFPATTIELSR